MLLVAFVHRWLNGPTYLGGGMPWWLDYGMKDIYWSCSHSGIGSLPGTPH